MKPSMEIEQTDNGWILRFTGHDMLPKVKSLNAWEKVLEVLDDYFGWYRDDKWTKDGS